MMRLLRFPDLKALKGIPFSRMHLDRLEKADLFPKRIHLGPMTVAWIEEEVHAHLKAKMAERSAA
jgi:prophage regulatory protein